MLGRTALPNTLGCILASVQSNSSYFWLWLIFHLKKDLYKTQNFDSDDVLDLSNLCKYYFNYF